MAQKRTSNALNTTLPSVANTNLSPQSNHEPAPPIKRMRKGTKSCIECRRRKIKCVFDPSRPDVCNDCFARGVSCIDQEHAESQPRPSDQNGSLKGRVAQLEDLVRTLVTKLDAQGDAQTDVSIPASQDTNSTDARQGMSTTPTTYHSIMNMPFQMSRQQSSNSANTSQLTRPEATTARRRSWSHGRPQSPTSLPPPTLRTKSDLGEAPVLSLFDNSIVTPQGGWHDEVTTATSHDVPDSALPNEYNKEAELRQTLLSFLPSRHATSVVSRFGCWWDEWTRSMPDLFDARAETLEDNIFRVVREGSVCTIARVLLCISMCLQQMPASYDFSPLGLPLPPYELADFYVREVYKRVIADDDIAGTLDGIECIIIFNKFTFNAGRPRKAWLALRRALTFAQLLNLHRKSARSVPSPGFSPARKAQIWVSLCMVDKFCALIIGQPYTIPLNRGDKELIDPLLGGQSNFILNLAHLCGRIVDRNQDLANTRKAMATTTEIEREFDTLVKSIDPDFWDLSNVRSTEPSDRFMLLVTFHQVRSLLHLPFMLQAANDPRFKHSKQEALDASRKTIETYRVLRTKRGNLPYVCKIIDFQVFTSAMLLILDVLGRGQESRSQNLRDWDMAVRTTELLRETENEIGGKVSAQCVRVLELFTSCRPPSGGGDNPSCDSSAKVVVPFFGTLVLQAGSGFRLQKLQELRNGRIHVPAQLLTPPSGTDSSATSPVLSPPPQGLEMFANPSTVDFGQEFGTLPDDLSQLQSLDQFDPCALMAGWDAWPNMFNMDLDHDWNWYLTADTAAA